MLSMKTERSCVGQDFVFDRLVDVNHAEMREYKLSFTWPLMSQDILVFARVSPGKVFLCCHLNGWFSTPLLFLTDGGPPGIYLGIF